MYRRVARFDVTGRNIRHTASAGEKLAESVVEVTRVEAIQRADRSTQLADTHPDVDDPVPYRRPPGRVM